MSDDHEHEQIPLDALLKAAGELPPGSKLHVALVLLVTKIDRGFSAIHYYIRTVGERSTLTAAQLEEYDDRLRSLEEWKIEVTASTKANHEIAQAQEREITARHELAKVTERVKMQEEIEAKASKEANKAEAKEKRQDEWQKLNLRWKMTIVGGAIGLGTGFVSIILKLIELLLN